MNEHFDHNIESDLEVFDFDEYYPEEAWEEFYEANRLSENASKESTHEAVELVETVSNDEFLSAIFGNTFTEVHPLVCKKSGDPAFGGWPANKWPCDTNLAHLNWYTLPSLYRPDGSGRYRAKKEFAVSVHAVMVDDVGTKVPAKKFANCPPSWAIETSPGNCQYGYILIEPITDLDTADKLKEKLIDAGLCDSGATGGTARWMRLPVAINGRKKYGSPSPKCKLVQWHPELKYSVDQLYQGLGLHQHQVVQSGILGASNSTVVNSPSASPTSDDATLVIEALQARGLYKSALGSGKHDITCPWVGGHTDAVDNGTAYFEPNSKFPTGGFKCHHSHGSLFHISDLKKFLDLNSADSQTIENTQPQKLPSALKPVPLLDSAYLPDAVRDAVIDLAERLQCPPDYLAVAMLSAAGAVVGNSVGIFPYAHDETWEVYPAIWGGIVGDPGSKKSPSLQNAHKPIQHLDEQAAQKHIQDMLVYEQAKAQYDQAVKVSKGKNGSTLTLLPPTEPRRERFIVNDSTYQALGVILSENPRGVLVLADELSGLLQSLDTAGQEAARGFYLSGWSGTGSYTFDRIERGTITLNRFCLSVFGGFQPDRIRGYVNLSQRGSSKNDGLLQRFQLLVWPDPLPQFKMVDRPANHQALAKYHRAVLNLNKISQSAIKDARLLANGAQLLHFTPSAQIAFSSWYCQNEIMLSNGELDPARQSHFSKYRSLVPGLALLFHLLDGHSGAVCEDCTNKAIAFSKYLKKHANRIYASVSGHDHAAVQVLASRLLNGQLKDGFTCRTLTLKGWAGLATKEQAQAAIDALVEYNWLIETESRSGGRPTVKYSLNPNATKNLL